MKKLALLTCLLLLPSLVRADEFWVYKWVQVGKSVQRVTYCKYVLHNFVYFPPKRRIYGSDSACTAAWRAQIKANISRVTNLLPPIHFNRPGVTTDW